jgi:hypothetical protein
MRQLLPVGLSRHKIDSYIDTVKHNYCGLSYCEGILQVKKFNK